MNTTRRAGAAAGYRWLVRAVNIGRRNPGAVFGGAAWMLGAVIVSTVAFVLLALGLQLGFEPSPAMSLVFSLLAVLPMLLVMALAMVGYLRLIDAVESGRPVRASAALAGFRAPRDGLRLFGAMLVVMVMQQLLMVVVIALLAPDVGRWYLASMQGALAQQPVPSGLPGDFWRAYGLIMLLALFVYAVQAIAFPQLVLRGASVGRSLRDGVTGALRNLLPLLVMLLVGIAAAIVLAIGVVLVALLIGLLGGIAGTAGNWLSIVLVVVLYVAMLLAVIAFSMALMYYMWRDIAGTPSQAPGAAPGEAFAA